MRRFTISSAFPFSFSPDLYNSITRQSLICQTSHLQLSLFQSVLHTPRRAFIADPTWNTQPTDQLEEILSFIHSSLLPLYIFLPLEKTWLNTIKTTCYCQMKPSLSSWNHWVIQVGQDLGVSLRRVWHFCSPGQHWIQTRLVKPFFRQVLKATKDKEFKNCPSNLFPQLTIPKGKTILYQARYSSSFQKL